jgi:hypothetical protein
VGTPTPFVNSFYNPTVGSLRYNTAQKGSPLPIVIGTQRVPVNLLEFYGYNGAGSKVNSGKGGIIGKSGGANKKANTTFSVFVAFGICVGPVGFWGASYGGGGNNRIWANAGVSFNGPGGVGLNYNQGYDGQALDGAFTAQNPNQPFINYSGTAYMAGAPMFLGNSPALPNISFEVTGFYAGTAGPNYPDDARPDHALTGILTDPRWGAGFPLSALDPASVADWGNFCQAANIAISMLIDRSQTAASLIEELCTLTTSAAVFTSGLLKIIPYQTTGPWASDFVTWTPNTTIQYSLDDDDFLDWGGQSDPVIATRNDRTQATNWISCEYLDRGDNYNANINFAFDQGAIDSFGLRTAAVSDAHSVCNPFTAYWVPWFQLQRKQLVDTTYKFKLGWRYALLDPMDLVELTDPGAGLYGVPVRITSIEEDDDFNLTITAENAPGLPSSSPPAVVVVE